jgi:hypothetical protein
MNENKIVNLLIPIIAIVVVFESVVLVGNLNKGIDTSKETPTTAKEATSSTEIKEEEKPIVDLIFATSTKEMKVGKTYKVELSMIAKEDRNADALENYIKYDSEAFGISGLTLNSELPKPSVNKVDTESGLIKSVVLIEKKAGFSLSKDMAIPVLSFNVTPKKEGNFSFEIGTGNEDKKFVTMIVETITSKVIPFTSNKLEVNVTE